MVGNDSREAGLFLAGTRDQSAVRFQEAGHGLNHNYVRGSPHLKHDHLRAKIDNSLTTAIPLLDRGHSPVEVLEVGAGHGSFTTTIRSTHARVTVTEMSKPSADYLQQRYAGDPGVEVVYDPDGRWIFETDRTFDAVVCISVLHHIPDYLAAIQRYTELTRSGGTFISWQDPIWYARLPPRQRRAAQAAYYSWRVVRTPWRQGAGTLLRRVRGTLDEQNPADMVEYHVVRNGVDERAIQAALSTHYSSLQYEAYWSTQSRLWQSWGDQRAFVSSFGFVASGKRTQT